MWSSTRASRYSRRAPLCHAIGFLACLSLAGNESCSRCTDDEAASGDGDAAFAKLSDLRGTVEWREGREGNFRKAKEGQSLSVWDAVRTGPDSHASVFFSDGAFLDLKAETELGLVTIEDEFALLLEQGEIEASSEEAREGTYRLVVGGATDFVAVYDGRVQFVKKKGSIRTRVLVGRATIVRGGREIRLKDGGSFHLDIGSVEIEQEVLPVTLRDRKRSSRILSPGARSFKRTRRAEVPLAPGTALKIGRGGTVTLEEPGPSRVALLPGTRADFEGAFRSSRGREGKLGLDVGGARIRLRRDSGAEASQEVVTPEASVVASASGLTAEVDIRSRKGSTRVVVHAGRADVVAKGRTIVVKADQALSIGPDGKVTGPFSPPGVRVGAREGSRSRVFYDRLPPRVCFVFKPLEKGQEAHLEVSRSSSFKNPVLREPVDGWSFSYPRLRAGNYFWRILGRTAEARPGPTGRLQIRRDPEAGRMRSRRLTNVVRDTGIQTTVLFQGKAPSLIFKWKKVKEAAGYRVKIYAERDIEKPLIDYEVSKARLVIPSGKLKEGTYYWYQTALGVSGENQKTSQMNKLKVAFDNAVPFLRIKSPRPGARPKGGRLRIQGQALLGARVTVNHVPLKINADGRFDQTLSKVAPGTFLVFHLKKPGAGDVYYTRRLGR